MESRAYWGPVCSLRSQLRCWVRLRASDGSAPWTTDWGMLLTLPTDGYLEASDGPVPIRHVEWVEIATMRVKDGIRGLPLEMIEITEELLAGLHEMPIAWDLRQATWAIQGVFAERPVQVVHISNPWGPPQHGP